MKRILIITKTGNTVFTNSWGTKYSTTKSAVTPWELAVTPQKTVWMERLTAKVAVKLGEPVTAVRRGTFQ